MEIISEEKRLAWLNHQSDLMNKYGHLSIPQIMERLHEVKNKLPALAGSERKEKDMARKKKEIKFQCPKCKKFSVGEQQGHWFVHPPKCPECKVAWDLVIDDHKTADREG